jgi:hypothetical protein
VTAWDVAVKRLPVVSVFVYEDAIAGDGMQKGALISELGRREFSFVPWERKSRFGYVVCLRLNGDCRRLFRKNRFAGPLIRNLVIRAGVAFVVCFHPFGEQLEAVCDNLIVDGV